MIKINYTVTPKALNCLFSILFICSLVSCKKTPSDPPAQPGNKEIVTKKDYKDFELDRMAAISGFYITDTIWKNGDISDFNIRKNFEYEFSYPISGDHQSLYLGAAIDGKYFIENNGVFKEYTKFQKNPLSLVTTSAYNVNSPNFRLDVPIKNLSGMDSLVREYLSGAEPSIYGFSQYFHYHFSNYNQLRLLFGENVDIRNLLKISAADDLAKVENGIVYYDKKETFQLSFPTDGKDFFKQPYNPETIKNDEGGYIRSVTYGKISIMTIDSKLDWRETRRIVFKVKMNQALSAAEQEVLNTFKVHTYLRGYNMDDQNKISKNTASLDIIKAFYTVSDEPVNFVNSGKFSYGDHGVPLFFELRSASGDRIFLKDANYTKSLKL